MTTVKTLTPRSTGTHTHTHTHTAEGKSGACSLSSSSDLTSTLADGVEILRVILTSSLPHPSPQQLVLQIRPPRWTLNLSTSLPSTAITEPSRLTRTIATTSCLVSLLCLLPCNHPFSLSSPSGLFKTQIQSGSGLLKPFP